MDTMESKIRSIIADKLGVDAAEVTPSARFVEDLGADSLDQVELLMAIEEDLGVSVPDEEVNKLQTLADVARYVAAQSRQAA